MSQFLIVKGPNRGVSYELGDRTRVGRLGESEIQVADPNVSRMHAEIMREGDGFAIYDRGSKNGIEVNGKMVADHQLSAGDLITVGSATFLFDGPLELQNARFSCAPVVTLRQAVDDSTPAELKSARDADPAQCTATLTQQLLEQPHTRQGLLLRLCNGLISCFNATSAVIFLEDYPGGGLNPIEAAPRNRTAFISGQLLERCVREKQVVSGTVRLDWTTLGKYIEPTGDDHQPKALNLLLAPITGSSGASGAVIIAGDEKRVFSQEDASALQTVASIAALALQTAAQLESVNHLSSPPSDAEERAGTTRSLRMQEIYNSARRSASGKAPILIAGETGSGKKTLAKFIHAVSERAAGPFVVVQCASIPAKELEAVLFGVETTSEDGEITIQAGKLDEAAGGTLFLEEVGDLDLAFQPMLLRFIQDHAYTRVNSTCAAKADIKVLASTSKDLAAAVRSGHFREDLWYRMNVVPFHIPPLRERREDIAPLLDSFVQDYSTRFNKRIIGANDTAVNLLQKYDWPGNIRELKNAVERAVLLAESKVLSTSDFSHIEEARRQLNAKSDLERKRDTRPLAEVERQHIIIALKKHQFNQARAAEALGLHRNTLRNKIIEYGIEIPK